MVYSKYQVNPVFLICLLCLVNRKVRKDFRKEHKALFYTIR
jgi:hypothetical protein